MGLFSKLEKLEIETFSKVARAGLAREGAFEVMFNPAQFTMTLANKFEPIQGLNTSGRSARYIQSDPLKVTLDLHLDGTGVGDMGVSTLLGMGADSVARQVADFRKLCFDLDGKIHQPKFLRLNWGDGPLKKFDCRLEKVKIDYTSFGKDGSPLAAKLTATFVEDMDAAKRKQVDGKSSPDLTHRRTVRTGDTLPLLCNEIYGSSAHYLWVARANWTTSATSCLDTSSCSRRSSRRRLMSVVTPTIVAGGKTIDLQYELLAVDVHTELNRIPTAQLTFRDGDSATGEFPISDSPDFEPGSKVEIKLRYEGASDATVFEGVVVRQGLQVRPGGSRIVVDLKDEVIKLASPRRSRVFRDMTDDKAFGEILRAAKGRIAKTQPKHAELVQYYATDWDFIVSRAEALGVLVHVEAGKVSVSETTEKGTGSHELQYGIDNIFDIEVEADATHQRKAFESIGWDLGAQKLTKPAKGRDRKSNQGNLKSVTVAENVGFTDPWTLAHTVPLTPADLQAWSSARAARSQMALLRGRISIAGDGTVKPMDELTLNGIGQRFNGKTIVTGVRHRVSGQGWRTDVQFGLSPALFARRSELAEAPAGGLLPAVSGLQIGVVDKFEEDPEKEFRVRVLLPSLYSDSENGLVWARLSALDAGKARGFFFRPEPGDEVVVGFFDNDPRHAVILGGLYGSKNTPPESVGDVVEENESKAIVTRAGTTIGFLDADKPSVFIETPSGHKLLLDDDAKKIELVDADGNTITMDADGIVLKSSKDIVIDASGNVEIKGSAVNMK